MAKGLFRQAPFGACSFGGGLCGAKNWRLPTKYELTKLVFCADGKYDFNGSLFVNS